MSRVEVITHGCRLNIAESERIAAMLAGAGDDLVVINSCAVTAEAVKTARQAIRRARRDRPDARIVVTGCAAQIEPDTFRAMPEVTGVVSNTAKLDPTHYPSSLPAHHPSPPRRQEPISLASVIDQRTVAAPAPPPRRGEHARFFLPVQNGCDHRCTFCIIPYGRGASRSLPAGGVIDEVRAAVDGGAREVVLTGVDLTAYGADLPGSPTLGRLVERILTHVPALARLRLSSLDPCEVDDRLFALLTGEARLMPHVHLSLQAGHDLILKRMKRRHARADAVDLVARLKAARPEIAIGADLIAGFPTEDEAMFADTLGLVDDCAIVFGHIFPYSPRTGTPAARMPQVAHSAIKARAARLRGACAAAKAGWLKEQIGTVAQVLVENDGVHGHAGNFARVAVAGGAANRILPVRITGVDGETLIGVAA
ncbi:tRNA (N(6)-L-threonylcarbamoyladenosine(37)-C(2))-methylthiotransferase MtaB [uncultured Sphingomonas sp.]|uniref:tRNA (N(6)-L-threonylcarbamoyladenosine(37)-C(2))- methylthiotransferase MtaB n=1 Tax=uncultured Sphingomonas sp. TaxID=158754 RepID=UPI0025D17E65|nr:tRNA (N(6)-L-threonylcarbamoyladenosine(37)-C(2))-methylthiotransferase MtaB [uncultured Sphingomonas sp.]